MEFVLSKIALYLGYGIMIALMLILFFFLIAVLHATITTIIKRSMKND